MKPDILKDKILSKIESLLGTYTIESYTVPAIWIGNPPTNGIARGLECLINEMPESSVPGNNITCDTWKIILTQHEGSDNLREATEKLKVILRPCRVFFMQKPASVQLQDFGILPQVVIMYDLKEIYQ